ncbi:MAG: cytidine deaminase [Gemmatimonadetes bacterium]|nr:cytidine deaminase [Gemmatimonadota bacterium]
MNSETTQKLVEAARAAAAAAYAPYSRYHVGAALLTSSGEIVTGCNVENSSFGLSICAERSAVFTARGRMPIDQETAPLAGVAIHSPGPAMPWPCGACRHVLHEFAPASMPVIVDGPDGTFDTTLGELLPHAFRLETE